MAARAMWKGCVSFGSIEVPVKLYSAVQREGVHFTLLDAKKEEPIVQRLINPASGEVVEFANTKRAYETDEGDLVLLDPDELDELEPKASREIEVQHFVADGEITPEWYDRPYYLGPDGGKSDYFALVQALENEKKVGVARWVMRKKEYVGALRVEGDYLMLITLRHAGEVIPAAELSPPPGRDLAKQEVEMAKQLIAALESDLDLRQYKDEYRGRVEELVEAKAKGKVIRMPPAPRKRKAEPLAQALERSLAAAKKGSAKGRERKSA